MFAGKKSAQIREILISESAWEEMTCLFAPSLEELSSWTISFENDSPECLYEFERLLNDYALREKLQHKIGALRDSIVHKVLRSVDERLS